MPSPRRARLATNSSRSSICCCRFSTPPRCARSCAPAARTWPALKDALNEHLDRTTPRLPNDEDREVQPTLGFQRVLQRAVFHVQSSGKKEVGVANVLIAIFSEKQSHAVHLLNRAEVTRLDVVNFVSHGLSKIAEEKTAQGRDRRRGRARRRRRQRARQVHHQSQPARAGRQDRSADRPHSSRSSAPSRSCAAAARTIRCTSAKPASARRRLPKASRA